MKANQISVNSLNDCPPTSTTYCGTYNPNYNFYPPSGWRCPQCGRIYSPSTPMCYYCGNQSVTINTTTTTNQPEKEKELDWEKLLKDYLTCEDLPYETYLNYLNPNAIGHMFEVPLHNTTTY